MEAGLVSLPRQQPAPQLTTPALYRSSHRATIHHASTQAPRAEAVEKGRLLVMEGGRWDEGGQGHEEVPRTGEVRLFPPQQRCLESTPTDARWGHPPSSQFADPSSCCPTGRTTTPTTKSVDKFADCLTSSRDYHLRTRFEQSIKTSFSPSCTTWASSIEEPR